MQNLSKNKVKCPDIMCQPQYADLAVLTEDHNGCYTTLGPVQCAWHSVTTNYQKNVQKLPYMEVLNVPTIMYCGYFCYSNYQTYHLEYGILVNGINENPLYFTTAFYTSYTLYMLLPFMCSCLCIFYSLFVVYFHLTWMYLTTIIFWYKCSHHIWCAITSKNQVLYVTR